MTARLLNAIEMPARHINATGYDRAEQYIGCGLIARTDLTRQFHVDRAPLLLPSLARLHEYGALGQMDTDISYRCIHQAMVPNETLAAICRSNKTKFTPAKTNNVNTKTAIAPNVLLAINDDITILI